MIGSFLTRGLVMVLGYAYPAYECYKTVEKNKPEIEQLRFWCQYWILVALLTVGERVGDTFVSWVPMYSEAKLAFFIYLWYPKTRGTTYVYDSFFRPYVAKHEPEIDRNLLELRTRAGDMAILYWQRAFSYGQTRIFDVLQYVAAQSTPAHPPAQGPRARQPATAANRRPAAVEPQSEEPPSPTSSTSSSQYQKDVEAEIASSQMPKAAPKAAPRSAAPLNAKKSIAQSNVEKATTAAPEAASHSALTLAEAMQIEAMPSSSSANESTTPAPKETVMEETISVTRGRLRKARSAPIR